MRVVFTAEVLADEYLWRELDRILGTVEDGWHLWELPDPDGVETSAWLERDSRGLRGLFETATRTSAWLGRSGPHLRRVFVVKGSQDEDTVGEHLRLPAPVARRFLGQPLRILMENVETDGAFLDAVIDVLGPEALHALKSCEPPALEYDSPGGSGELPKRVDYHLDDPAWQGVPRRLFVFTDSDGLVPGHRDRKAQAIADKCELRGVPYHILAKRCVENYLPQEVLESWVESPDNARARPKVAALARLDVEQRDHFPMKKAFPKGIPEEQTELFLPPRWAEKDREIFVEFGGFGKEVVLLFRDYRDAITPEALRSRCGRLDAGSDDTMTELDILIRRICAEL